MTKSRKIYVVISWILVLACMVVIFCLSAQTATESANLSGSFIRAIFQLIGIELGQEGIRTVAHCLEFMGLSLLIFNATYATWEMKLTPIIAFAGTVLYAVTDEIHQIFVPGRAFQISDILVDSTGALIGVTASFIILKIVLYIIERGKKNGNS
ncbi:MAG: VanZ family protein [Clostridia bacterium]|nr:VanZ family protein [Clostridia bacterium]